MKNEQDPKDHAKKKLNVAIVCDPITDYTAGSFVSTLRFAELLSNRGHKIIFIAAKSPTNHQDNYYKNIKIYRFFSVLLPKSENMFYLSFPAIYQVKKILADEKIDIVHTMIPTPSAIISIRAAKQLRIPVVVHSHAQPENIFLHLPKMLVSKRINDIFYKYLLWIYKQADYIVYPSEFARQLFIKFNIEVETAVISNGVDTDEYKKIDTEEFFKKFNLPKDVKKILYVGRMHPEKSLDTLIDSVPFISNKIPNIQVYIVGFGHMEEKLKKHAKSLGLEKKIIFFGKLSDEDKILAFNACDLFVLPSLAELEGMVVLEAMACGKPILIANAKDSASTFFVSENGLLFEPENPEDLARQAVKILSNDSLRSKMGDASLETSKKYDINESVSRLEEIYYSVLGR
jgi:1,2-diacylglycerol 3-alpha-glucosyltransferase